MEEVKKDDIVEEKKVEKVEEEKKDDMVVAEEKVQEIAEKKVEAGDVLSVEPGYARCLRCGNTWQLRSLTPGKKKCPVCGSQRVIKNIQALVKKEEKKEKEEKVIAKTEKKEERKEEKKKDLKGWLWALIGFVAVSAVLSIWFLKGNRGREREESNERADEGAGGYRFNYIPGLR